MNEKKFSRIVDLFLQTKDRHNNTLNMNYLLIHQNEQTYVHHFKNWNKPSDVRSISKTVMTIAFGIVKKLAKEGKYPEINENTYIFPIIKDGVTIKNKENIPKLKKVQIKHLLTHTIGFEDVLLMRNDIIDIDPYSLVDYVINYPIVHEPGDYYLYSNAGFYLLSVVLQEFLQEDLHTFLQRELFEPLGIKNFTWEKYGNYIAGATRLWLMPEDLLAIGQLLLNNGKYNGRQILPASWIQKMLQINTHTKNVDTPHAIFRRYGYGYGLWLAKKNIYFGHGTDGQILAIIPEKDAIIITLSEQEDMKPIEHIVNQIIEQKL